MNKHSLLKCLLGLLLFTAISPSTVIAQTKSAKSTTVSANMTVIKIYPVAKTDTLIRVIFQVSERIYKLPVKAKSVYLRRLKQSMNKHIPVLIKRASEQSDVIIEVDKAGKK